MLKLPPFGAGQRIGLFGGSFNPAHRGHYMVALYALKKLRLDYVWWLVSPQNPLKSRYETGDYDERLVYARRIARHPKFVVTDLERQMRSAYTADTLMRLRGAMARGKFVWIMGADSFFTMHRWHEWEEIFSALPLAVMARPGHAIRALNGKTALRLAQRRVPEQEASRIVGAKAPAWVFVSMPLRKESSTAIRKRRKAQGLKPSATSSKKSSSRKGK
jgi:nicotinate-nucleotide adenylyltransferase